MIENNNKLDVFLNADLDLILENMHTRFLLGSLYFPQPSDNLECQSRRVIGN